MPKTINPNNPKGALKVRETCDFLSISRSTLNRFIEEGQIKPIRKMRHLLIPMSEIERFLKE